MRKIIYAINLTLDGCCDHTQVVADDELHEFYTNLLRDAGLLVYGRITFELMVPYWPDVANNPNGHEKGDVESAKVFDSLEKLVFSKTLEKTTDTNSRIVRTHPEEELLKLKEQDGKDIFVGGVSFPSYLVTQGLIDEFIFVVQPIIAGKGRRLLDGNGLINSLALSLIDSTVLKSGSVVLRYKKTQ